MTKLTTEEMQRIVADLTPHPLAENELRDAGVLDTMTEAKEAILAQQQEIERLRERLDKAHDLLMDSDYNPAFITAQFGEKEQDHE